MALYWIRDYVEHQIPNIKVLFKRNAKSHKHPGIKLLSSESQTQLVNQIKQNSYRNIDIAYTILTQSFWTGTKAMLVGVQQNGRLSKRMG